MVLCAPYPFIRHDIVASHSYRGISSLKFLPANGTADLLNSLKRFFCFSDVLDDKSSFAVFQNFRNGTTIERDDRSPACELLDHHQAKWFRPINGEDKRPGATQQIVLLRLVHFPHKLDQGTIKQWFDFGMKVLFIQFVNFRCNL